MNAPFAPDFCLISAKTCFRALMRAAGLVFCVTHPPASTRYLQLKASFIAAEVACAGAAERERARRAADAAVVRIFMMFSSIHKLSSAVLSELQSYRAALMPFAPHNANKQQILYKSRSKQELVAVKGEIQLERCISQNAMHTSKILLKAIKFHFMDHKSRCP